MHKPSQKTALKSRTAAQMIVDALSANGLTTAFGVPGESYLAVLDAMYQSPVEFIICRQEGGAAMMAEAVGKVTGKPGVCFVTRGPGATNASSGVHVAQQDSTPMLLFVGQVAREFRGREAFQEVDHEKFFAPLAKWAVEIDDASRVPEIIARAIRVATQGRPGPVVISLPEDVLSEEATVADAPVVEPAETWPANADMMRLQKMLAQAKKPIAIVGGSRWSEKACAALRRFAERFDMPVVASFRRQSLFSAENEQYSGELILGTNPKLFERVKSADLVLLIGGRLGEIPTQGYELLDVPLPQMPLVHVHAEASELGRVYQPALAIHATPNAFCAMLESVQPPVQIAWGDWRKTARADYLEWSSEVKPHPGDVQMSTIVNWLRKNLPQDAFVTTGAGNFAVWSQRFLRFQKYGTQLGPVSGSMGYGVPAAIAAKRLHPERVALAFAGDGDFMMTGQELATAVQYDIGVKIIVLDNGTYGTIRMHQEREYPGRVSGTDLRNPDFAALARAYGAEGFTVSKDSEAVPALEAAFKTAGPAVVHVKIATEAISPNATLTQIRERALKSRS
ncbi:MAG TPA: thiamine pyrophosphate-binding protein [Xanthobacteraceae bacterium]|nr:thiamine pyrophosphate-binding protein [Xanthobacteraceae bacterium]